MPTTTLTEISSLKQLKKMLSSQPKLIVMNSASYCGPCQTIKPKLEEMAKNNSAIQFAYLDVQSFKDSKDKDYLQQITALPTFYSYSKGLINDVVVGSNYGQVKQMAERLKDA